MTDHDPAPANDLYQPWGYTLGLHHAERITKRDDAAHPPHLRVIAPCVIHPGQTIDIDLTTGTVTVKETP